MCWHDTQQTKITKIIENVQKIVKKKKRNECRKSGNILRANIQVYQKKKKCLKCILFIIHVTPFFLLSFSIFICLLFIFKVWISNKTLCLCFVDWMCYSSIQMNILRKNEMNFPYKYFIYFVFGENILITYKNLKHHFVADDAKKRIFNTDKQTNKKACVISI